MYHKALRKGFYQKNLNLSSLSDLDGIINSFPRNIYQSSYGGWSRNDCQLETEESLIKKIVIQRLALEEALTKDSAKTKSDGRFSNKKSNCFNLSKSQHRDQSRRPNSHDLFYQYSNMHGSGSQTPKRALSIQGRKITYASLDEQDRRNLRPSVEQQGEHKVKSKVVDRQEEQKQKRCTGGKQVTLSTLQQQLACLKQQLNQKNRTIVDMECKMLKLQSKQHQNLQQNDLKIARSSQKKQLHLYMTTPINVTPSRSRNKLSTCNQISMSVPRCEIEKQTKESFFETTSDMKNLVTQCSNLQENSMLEKGQVENTSQMSFFNNESIKFSSTVPPLKKESFAESIIFEADQTEDEFDLTLSVSQVYVPKGVVKGFSKKESKFYDLTLSASQCPNGSPSNQSVELQFQKEELTMSDEHDKPMEGKLPADADQKLPKSQDS